MELLFTVKKVEYAKRDGNLDAEAVGVVKSKKHFPYYNLEDGTKEIFKPLTKTKPFTTPLYAYAEVFWSYVINQYFMEAPCYQLAICEGYAKEKPRYYDYGTLVPSVCKEGEHLINLLEYFKENPDEKVDIENYVNYCMLFYDYRSIFESEFIQKKTKIGKDLAMQVLLSILKGDQNFHYENVAFVCNEKGRVLRLAPMVDHEFSTMFLFPDDVRKNATCLLQLLGSIEGKETTEAFKAKNKDERKLLLKSAKVLNQNIRYILEHYPKVVSTFLKGLKKLEKDLDDISLQDEGYLFPCNSYAFEIGQARYKESNEEKAVKLEEELEYKDIDLPLFEEKMKFEIKKVIAVLQRELEK